MDCNKIVEFEDQHIELLENCITKRLGFSPASKSLRIEANCDELAQVRRVREPQGGARNLRFQDFEISAQ